MLYAKKDFTDEIELMILGWGNYHKLIGEAQCIQKGSLKRNSWRSQREDEEHAMTEAEGENAI